MTKQAQIIGLIYVAGDNGISVKQIHAATQIPVDEIQNQVDRINHLMITDSNSPFKLLKIDDRWQLVTKSSLDDIIQKYFRSHHTSILTTAALETLTIVAYRQPVTRIEIDEIRGVNSSVTIEKLLRQRLIKTAGRKKVIGNPIMYATTDAFLNLFGLKNIEQLPKLKSKEESDWKDYKK